MQILICQYVIHFMVAVVNISIYLTLLGKLSRRFNFHGVGSNSKQPSQLKSGFRSLRFNQVKSTQVRIQIIAPRLKNDTFGENITESLQTNQVLDK